MRVIRLLREAGLTGRSKTENHHNKCHDYLERFSRQTAFSRLGIDGQLAISKCSVLVVGAGGLGSWTAEFLVRAGIGHIRLCDDDTAELSNLHRQAIYTEYDANTRRLKVESAAERLRLINSNCRVDVFPLRVDRLTIHSAAAQMDIIIDGTDNYAGRFLINDYSIKYSVPWVLAGVTGTQGQVMSIIPGRTVCLQCLIPSPHVCAGGNECVFSGVVGPVVPFISALQSMEAIKILAGCLDSVNSSIVKFDLWDNCYQKIDLSNYRQSVPCLCCGERDFVYLEP